ncbi:MAG: hypothetical protein K2H53_04945 [Clostridia bacterium]|nr:hypothetical protein [Clostridia bacterium]
MDNNIDMNKLMNMLSKMDKKDLEKGMAQVSEILKTKNVDEIMKNLNKGKK